MPGIPTIWAKPHLLDHSTGLQVPMGSAAAGTNLSVLFDGKPALELLSTTTSPTGHWLLTLDMPLQQPLAEPLLLHGRLRYWVAQPAGGRVRVRFSAAGQAVEATFEAPTGTIDEQDIVWPALLLPLGTARLDARLEVWLRRTNQEQVAVQLTSLDLSGPLPPSPA